MQNARLPLLTLTAPIFVAMACSSSARTSDSAIDGRDAIAADDAIVTGDVTVSTDAVVADDAAIADSAVADDVRSAPAYDASVASIDPPPCDSFCSSVKPSYPTNEAWGGVG